MPQDLLAQLDRHPTQAPSRDHARPEVFGRGRLRWRPGFGDHLGLGSDRGDQLGQSGSVFHFAGLATRLVNRFRPIRPLPQVRCEVVGNPGDLRTPVLLGGSPRHHRCRRVESDRVMPVTAGCVHPQRLSHPTTTEPKSFQVFLNTRRRPGSNQARANVLHLPQRFLTDRDQPHRRKVLLLSATSSIRRHVSHQLQGSRPRKTASERCHVTRDRSDRDRLKAINPPSKRSFHRGEEQRGHVRKNELPLNVPARNGIDAFTDGRPLVSVVARCVTEMVSQVAIAETIPRPSLVPRIQLGIQFALKLVGQFIGRSLRSLGTGDDFGLLGLNRPRAEGPPLQVVAALRRFPKRAHPHSGRTMIHGVFDDSFVRDAAPDFRRRSALASTVSTLVAPMTAFLKSRPRTIRHPSQGSEWTHCSRTNRFTSAIDFPTISRSSSQVYRTSSSIALNRAFAISNNP